MKVHASMSFGAKNGGAGEVFLNHQQVGCLARPRRRWDEVDRRMCVVKAVALIGDRVFLKAFLKNLCVCVCVCVCVWEVMWHEHF